MLRKGYQTAYINDYFSNIAEFVKPYSLLKIPLERERFCKLEDYVLVSGPDSFRMFSGINKHRFREYIEDIKALQQEHSVDENETFFTTEKVERVLKGACSGKELMYGLSNLIIAPVNSNAGRYERNAFNITALFLSSEMENSSYFIDKTKKQPEPRVEFWSKPKEKKSLWSRIKKGFNFVRGFKTSPSYA